MNETIKSKLHKFYAFGGLVQCGRGATGACTYQDFLTLLGRLFNYLMVLAVPLAILGIGVGALYMIMGASGEGRTKGKDIIFDSIIGLVVAIAAWLIINTVITILGANGFTNPLK